MAHKVSLKIVTAQKGLKRAHQGSLGPTKNKRGSLMGLFSEQKCARIIFGAQNWSGLTKTQTGRSGLIKNCQGSLDLKKGFKELIGAHQGSQRLPKTVGADGA